MSSTRTPVKRRRAEHYVLLMTIAFATTVVGTRLYLELTGYPQIGGGELHIAHAIWGGLAQFIALVIALSFANRWAYPLSAIIGGIGLGLFIDEIGKFITKTNDYFFPFAAPIIYIFFLLTVLLYLRLRRQAPPSPRADLYRAMDEFTEMLDRDLDKQELDSLRQRLQRIHDGPEHPEYRLIAAHLLDLVSHRDVVVKDYQPSKLDRIISRLLAFEKHYLHQPNMRRIVIGGLLAYGTAALVVQSITLLSFTTPTFMQEFSAMIVKEDALIAGPRSFIWYIITEALSIFIGLVVISGGIFMLYRRESLGVRAAWAGLIANLTIVNLLLFYYNQFATVTSSLITLALLFAVERYRARFIQPLLNGSASAVIVD